MVGNLTVSSPGGEKYLLITSKPANQRVQRVLFICAVYTNKDYCQKSGIIVSYHKFHRLILLLRFFFSVVIIIHGHEFETTESRTVHTI